MSTGFDNEINAVLNEAVSAFPSRAVINGVAVTGCRSAVDFAATLEEGGLQEAVDFNWHTKRSNFPAGQLPQVNDRIEIDGAYYRIVKTNRDEDDPEFRISLSADLSGT